jgi:hypothetical protein
LLPLRERALLVSVLLQGQQQELLWPQAMLSLEPQMQLSRRAFGRLVPSPKRRISLAAMPQRL